MTPERQQNARSWEDRLMAATHPVAWPVSRLARRLGPDVCYVPGLGYVVSGANLLREILLDAERFRKDGPSSVGTVITQVFGPTALANMEGEVHTALRRTLQPVFTPRAAEALLTEVTDPMFRDFAERLSQDGTVDLALEAQLLASTVVRGMITGAEEHLAPESALELHAVATRLAGLVSARVRPMRPAELRLAQALRDELIEIMGPSLATDDPSTIAGCLRSGGLGESEVRSVVAMVFVAGVETTSVAVPRTVALLSDVGLWPRLGAEPESIPSAVDEALRFLSPLPVCTRTVASTCEVAGFRLRGGRTLIGHLYSAVRDPRVIERGEEFDPDRLIPPVLRHLWFGAGAHFCIGMPIARQLVARTVQTLAQLGGVRIVARTPARRVLIPTYAELHVAVGRASPAMSR